MRLIALIVALLTIQTLYAGEKSYEAGKLNDVAINDMTSTIWLPTGHGNFPFPLQSVSTTNFRFQQKTVLFISQVVAQGARGTTVLSKRSLSSLCRI